MDVPFFLANYNKKKHEFPTWWKEEGRRKAVLPRERLHLQQKHISVFEDGTFTAEAV